MLSPTDQGSFDCGRHGTTPPGFQDFAKYVLFCVKGLYFGLWTGTSRSDRYWGGDLML